MENVESYSILMSVYCKENPHFFEEALNSLARQTLKTNDFVLVCDGPLTNELDAVIDKYSTIFGEKLNVIRLETNRGLGNALAVGIEHCKNEIVLRADSDDISIPRRAEKEIAFLNDQCADVVSTDVILFQRSINEPVGERKLPTSHEEILKMSKSRSPFNHPSVMFKKQAVLNAGNYKTLLFKEDYYLWVRMIQNGSRAANLSEPLVFMRVDDNLYKRRKNKDAYKSQKVLLKYMLKTRFIGRRVYLKSWFLYTALRVLPTPITKVAYSHVWKRTK